MLKSKLKTALILLIALILISSISFATTRSTTVEEDVSAISETSEETSIEEESSEEEVSEEEAYDTSDWVNNDLFICEDTVVVDQVIDGNAFIIGKNVTISGEIGGDLFVLADKLTIEDGYVYSSIFGCANEITVNGIIYDIYAVSNNFTLSEDGFVYRDLKVTANTINIEGKIKRNAYIDASNYNINEDTALIAGNLNYSAKEDISLSEDVVTGEITRTEPTEVETSNNIGSTILSYVSDLIKTLIYTFVVVLLLLWLAPKFVNKLGEMSIAKDFICLGIGLASIMAAIIGGIILLITVIGIPLFFSSLLILAILSSISFSITSIFFGKIFTKLLKAEGKVKFVLITLASAVALWALTQLPLIGGLVSLLITLFGIGATIVNIVYKNTTKVKEEVK